MRRGGGGGGRTVPAVIIMRWHHWEEISSHRQFAGVGVQQIPGECAGSLDVGDYAVV